MGRILSFKLKRKSFETIPVKIDRKKLYGWSEIVALDEKDRLCKLLNTDDTGRFIIPKGGIGMGILSPMGEWVERTSLKTIKLDGSSAEIIKSSFTKQIDLRDKISENQFLDYSTTDFYHLNVSEEIITAIGKNIYKFDYTYLDSYETSPAFLLVAENSLFMLIGYENRFDTVCLGDCGEINEDDDYIEIEDDDIDFSMF